jgi:protein ImuA
MATSAVAREAVFALRRQIAKIEGRLAETLDEPLTAGNGETQDRWVMRRHGRPDQAELLPTGSATLDDALGGGLPRAGLTEIHGAETRDAGAVAGFVLGLLAQAGLCASAERPLLWVATSEIISEAGAPYAPGIAAAYGIAPQTLLLATTPKLENALWIAEEAAGLSSLAAVLLEVRGAARKLDLTATRRLHRRALASGRALFLMRQAGQAEPTAAPVRLMVAGAPAAERTLLSGALAGSIGPPAISVTISRCRTTTTATATLEWNDHEHGFRQRQDASVRTQDPGSVASAPLERAHPAPTVWPGLAQGDGEGDVAA